MMTQLSIVACLLLLIPLLLLSGSCDAESQVHIVYFGEHSGGKTWKEIEDGHHSYLLSVKKSEEEARSSLVYSYKKIINGFSAWLTPHEAAKLSEINGVISVFKSQPGRYHLQTTRSWDFVSLLEGQELKHPTDEEELSRKANYGKDVIVGVFDSGIWPESESFSDQGMEPIPKRWKGICQSGAAFDTSHCNRKLIGARYYLNGYEAYHGPLNNIDDYRSPRDKNGHGTHAASIVGGRRVANISALGGLANGTASGGAPLVRLAIYKVCWPIPGLSRAEDNICFDEDMLAAFDDAIADGVDVLSISVGANNLDPYKIEVISIGSFYAMKRNIVVACSAGNEGPFPSTVKNVAPWIITVGASSIDRVFSSPAVLGNNMKIEGQTVTPYALKTMYPLVYAGDVEIPGTTTEDFSGQCLPGTLSPESVKGKIVLCQGGYSYDVQTALEVKRAGGAGFILQNPLDGIGISVVAHVLPGTTVFSNEPATILDYLRNTSNPMATIIPPTTVMNSKPSPFMAGFSSRGPNGLEPNILKPDITAPGLNILAAWSEGSSPTRLEEDKRVVKYNIFSGTSMSCPHVAAAAALIKAIHPNWSSAAIRSALMTTATTDDNRGMPMSDASGKPATPFHFGAGHFQPAKAAQPGLIYDANYHDYLLSLCGNGANNSLDPTFNCPENFPSASNLNYPSLSISSLIGTITVKRTVTNVGSSNPTTYNSTIQSPKGYIVEISPTTLSFSHLNEKNNFTITIKANDSVIQSGVYSFGWYIWSDGIHTVRSPIAVSSSLGHPPRQSRSSSMKRSKGKPLLILLGIIIFQIFIIFFT
ncbi:subtilisin-like protease SBT5.6 isoform X2 [Diospyros lotus]|uniref:subtilisin-like protease SBT5.6 isoform X2 n=1 Tax=Diospyros lotus TaxID=55363 RepID=UPI002254C600|nr:subtilisin-like protease SBT5.6 isoform X2 [Diospyros lotus]